MLKRGTLLAVASATTLGTAFSSTAAHAVTYSDITPNSLFYTEITWALNKGLIHGYSDGTFRPADSIDRQSLARVIYIYRGKPAYTPPTKSPFTDVPVGHPLYKEINWLVSQGITTGYPDKTFRPANTMNRGAFAAFLYRMAGEPTYIPPTTPYFPDVPSTELFYKEISWLKDTKITTGWTDGTYQPLEPIQRDATCAFLYRYNQAVGY